VQSSHVHGCWRNGFGIVRVLREVGSIGTRYGGEFFSAPVPSGFVLKTNCGNRGAFSVGGFGDGCVYRGGVRGTDFFSVSPVGDGFSSGRGCFGVDVPRARSGFDGADAERTGWGGHCGGDWDALRAMGVDPVDYLVVPRVAALLSSAPLLVAECVGVAVTAGYLVAVRVLGVSHAYYVTNMLKFTTGRDIKMALVKGFAFALVIGFIACDQGLRARNGAAGVGRAPTEAVVIASLVVLIANFFLSFALNLVFPA
jgi:hypothetical protein